MTPRVLVSCVLLVAIATTQPATAHFADYGPPDDVLWIRADMAKRHGLRPPDVPRVIVVRGYAEAVGSSKGTFVAWYRKRAGQWIELRINRVFVHDDSSAAAAESFGIPHDVARAMIRFGR